jgi:hypothetical protein
MLFKIKYKNEFAHKIYIYIYIYDSFINKYE